MASNTIPAWLTEAMRQPSSGSDRIGTAARIAQWFAGAGYQPAAILRSMAPYRDVCDPPMTAAELAEIIASASGYRAQARRAGIIAPPDMTRLPSGAGHRYAWADAGVAVALDRVNETRRGIEAELTVDCDLPDLPERLHGPIRIDMLSTPARATEARYLGDRLDVGWNDILETAFRLAIEAHREGEPPVRMSDPVLADDGGYAIDPLVPDGDPVLLFAKPGQGKSWVALAVAAALDMGDGVLPLPILRRHRVAYLDWEWKRAPHRRRLVQLLGARADDSNILYRRMNGTLVSQAEQLSRMIHEWGITYIVIDSIALACGGDPQEPGPVLAMANAVRSLGVGSLWVGHVPKHGDDETAFGSQFWGACARATWHVQCVSEPGAPVMRLALNQKKVNEGPPAPPISLRFDFRDGAATIARTDIMDEPAFQGILPPRVRIMAVLEGGAATVAELGAATGLTKAVLTRTLGEFARERRVVELSDGRWGKLVPAAAAPALELQPMTTEVLPW